MKRPLEWWRKVSSALGDPWSDDVPTPAPIEQMTVQVERFPRLLAVKVQPVLYNGVPTKWKLVFTFDRGDIVIGQSFNQEAMNELRDEIKKELGL